MDIYKDQDDEETEDAATSKAGTTLQSCPHFVNCIVGRLNSCGRVFCSAAECYLTARCRRKMFPRLEIDVALEMKS